MKYGPVLGIGAVVRLVLVTLTTTLGVLAFASAPALAKEAHVFSSSFGSEGSGAGQLLEPSGVAVNDRTGDVYVVDKGNSRVDEFESNGNFIRAWGWGVADGISEGAQTCTLTCFKGISGIGAGQFSEPEAIVVDNSGNALDPSKEDVYVTDTSDNVVDKFTSSGIYLGQISTGEGGAPFGSLLGVGVDADGLVWIDQETSEYAEEIDVFSDAEPNQFHSKLKYETTGGNAFIYRGFAVNATDNLYSFYGRNEIKSRIIEGHEESVSEHVRNLARLNSSGELLEPPKTGSNNSGIAVDLGDDALYLDQVISNVYPEYGAHYEQGAVVAEFASNGSESSVETFGAGHLTTGGALAINSSSGGALSGAAYVADPASDDIAIFTTILVPDITTGTAATQTEGVATLNGKVNPDGVALDTGTQGCRFEYATEEEYESTKTYGQTAACEHPDAAEIDPNGGEVAVHADIAAAPDTIYHYRLVAANANGEDPGEDRSFTAPARPAITGGAISGLGASEATIGAQVNPGGLATSYDVEYGTSTEYGSNTPEESAGAGTTPAAEQIRLGRLQSGVTYHARVVASNAFGSALGSDQVFTTASTVGASGPALPDGRAYELVSTVNDTDVYEPYLTEDDGKSLIESERPVRASAEGNSVAYVAEPPVKGGSGAQGDGLGNEYLATRTSQGWVANDIYPPGAPLNATYVSFSGDLSVGILKGLEAPAGAPCDEYLLRSGDGTLHAFFTEQLPAGCGGVGDGNESAFVGASADYSHLLLESQAALVPGAEESKEERQHNLYESVNGRLQLVNVLPGTDPQADSNATFGGPHGTPGRFNNAAGFTNVISNDGSRVFWTDLNTDDLYLRENGTTTVPVSAAASEYWTATPDGRYVYYTEGEESASRLWRFDVDKFAASTKPEPEALAEAREELTGEGSGVLGVIGINETGEDGAYVYFVAEGILATNENGNKQKATGDVPNLYVRSNGETKFIATLSPEDDHIAGPLTEQAVDYGDWKHNLGARTSEVTPDGRSVSFLSRASLTGYENSGCKNNQSEPVGCAEVYVYDAETGRLSCASCSPNGAPAITGAQVPITESTLVGGGAYMKRWLSDDGSRVFFDSSQPLVAQDDDKRLNVYEWERDGAGSCLQSTGCIYLLSGGSSPGDSYLLDASANGDDVFFTSREDFVPQTSGETVKLYDARVDGGFPETSTACTGAGCQGVPPAPPLFATPSSATIDGTDDFPPPSPAVVKPKSATQLKAEKLSKALKQCQKDRSKAKRKRCEASALKQYGTVKKTKKAKKAKKAKRASNDRRASS